MFRVQVEDRFETANLVFKMSSFHQNHGKRIELKNNGKTAQRNINEFNHGIVMSKHPLIDNVKFEVRIDVKIHSWSGSIEIGVRAIKFSSNYRFFVNFLL